MQPDGVNDAYKIPAQIIYDHPTVICNWLAKSYRIPALFKTIIQYDLYTICVSPNIRQKLLPMHQNQEGKNKAIKLIFPRKKVRLISKNKYCSHQKNSLKYHFLISNLRSITALSLHHKTADT